jgi:hypothetical protein
MNNSEALHAHPVFGLTTFLQPRREVAYWAMNVTGNYSVPADRECPDRVDFEPGLPPEQHERAARFISQHIATQRNAQAAIVFQSVPAAAVSPTESRIDTPRGVTALDAAHVCSNNASDAVAVKKKWDGRRGFYPNAIGEKKVRGGKAKTYDPAALIARALEHADIIRSELPRIRRDLGLEPSTGRRKVSTK